jgi:nucleoside-diphosphate-sugar epimerase
VVHLAAIAGVSDYYREPTRVLETNLLGTANVVACAARAGVKRFVFFSTSEVYGAQVLDAREDAPCAVGPPSDRRWVYATTKLAGEHLVLRSAEERGFAATVIRPFNIYGARQTGEGAISNFCAAAVRGAPLRVHGDGSAIRAWCHVDDLVAGVLVALASDKAAGHIFNLGNPTEVETTLGLARRVLRLAPGARLEHEKVARSDVLARTPSIEKARRLLGFEPSVDLDAGLARTLQWFRESAR